MSWGQSTGRIQHGVGMQGGPIGVSWRAGQGLTAECGLTPTLAHPQPWDLGAEQPCIQLMLPSLSSCQFSGPVGSSASQVP